MASRINLADLDPEEAKQACLEILTKLLGPIENLDENESDPAVLWDTIHRLRAEVQGPRPHATWRDAAMAERMYRVVAEKKLVILRTALQNELDLVELNAQTFMLLETEMKITAIPMAHIRAILDIPMTQPDGLLPPTNEVDETDPDNVPEVGSIWKHRKGDYYTVRGMTSQPDPEKADKFPRTVFYQGADGRRWTRTLESWMESFKLIVPPTNIAGKLLARDMRVIDGKIWYCTDPDIDRWVSQGEPYPAYGGSDADDCTCNPYPGAPHHESCPVTHAARAAFAASGESAQAQDKENNG